MKEEGGKSLGRGLPDVQEDASMMYGLRRLSGRKRISHCSHGVHTKEVLDRKSVV